VRAPAAAAPTQAAIAECSDSTVMKVAGSWPEAVISDRSSTIIVWGVIGYAEITSARESIAP
jgi:hypothetical protein